MNMWGLLTRNPSRNYKFLWNRRTDTGYVMKDDLLNATPCPSIA
jgi:hypothetical protein